RPTCLSLSTKRLSGSVQRIQGVQRVWRVGKFGEFRESGGVREVSAKSKSSLNWQQISAFRLARHSLLAPTARDPVAISRTLCGIQAQVMGSAHMAVWARAHHLRRADIASALNETRSLVKTLCMRRTLHLVPSDEFPVYISALRTSRMAA